MKAKIFLASAIMLMAGASAQAQSFGDLLKGLGSTGGDITSTIGNLVEGIFTKSDLTLEDLVGSYESDGPAVAFKSDNFLQKAGGIAGAAAVETKLQPYYEQYGLIGMPMTIDSDGNFTLAVKKLKLSGLVTKNNDEDGTFTFNIKMAGMTVGKFTAYVEKSGSNLNVMFDATKLKDFISLVSKYTGSSMTKALGSILDSYEGMCVGFKMKSTGKAASSTSATQSSDNAGDAGSAIGSLRDLLNRKK